MDLRDKTILITGASSGMGRALAVGLGAGANRFVLTARRAPLLDSLVAELEALGSQAIACPADGTEPEAARAVVEAGIAAFGGLDLAVLNAGGGRALSMADATVSDVISMMRTNYDTLVNSLCPVLEHMRGAGGGLVAYTGSPAGFFGLPKAGPYSAAKAAGRTLIDACRIELGPHNVRFVALYPGFTATEGLDPDDVPVKSLIIDEARATREIIYALTRERSHHMFPKRIRFLMALARILPEPLRRRLLGIGIN